ncbi:condensation domain-containing protein [Streptomyces sp. M10(2022)]
MLSARDVFEHRTPPHSPSSPPEAAPSRRRPPPPSCTARCPTRRRPRSAERGEGEILPVTPLQEGLLYLGLLDGPDTYVVQSSLDVEGTLDPDRMRTAVARLLDRHANLRAAFLHEALSAPVAFCASEVPVPWRHSDLCGLPVPEREDAARHAADEDRTAPFDPAVPSAADAPGHPGHHAPPTRPYLPPPAAGRLVAARPTARTAAPVRRRRRHVPEPAPPVPFSEHLRLLGARDREAGLAAWREALAGPVEPTLVAPGTTGVEHPSEVAEARLPARVTEQLEQRARAAGLTVASVVQGAWALVLGHLTGRADVVFGSTVAGRPAELEGHEGMVGLFANTLPVRVTWTPVSRCSTCW